ncbi:hypothetical protein K1719_000336 [Acacia pycnantha]|nr:hypothetical protein K1719_000336 [Acacia pycnantha]
MFVGCHPRMSHVSPDSSAQAVQPEPDQTATALAFKTTLPNFMIFHLILYDVSKHYSHMKERHCITMLLRISHVSPDSSTQVVQPELDQTTTALAFKTCGISNFLGTIKGKGVTCDKGSLTVRCAAHSYGCKVKSFTYEGEALHHDVTEVTQALAGITILSLCPSQYCTLPPGWFRFLKGKCLLDVILGFLTFPQIPQLRWFNQNLIRPPLPWLSRRVIFPIFEEPLRVNGLHVINVSICAPLWEEIFYRGFLMASLTKYTPVWYAILVSSIVFDVVDLNSRKMLPLVFFWMVSEATFSRSRNLSPPMLLRSLYNIFTISKSVLEIDSEIAYVVEGKVYSGFVDSSNKVFDRVLEKGEVMVFPRGLVHFFMNVVFGSGIDEKLLQKAFGLTPKQIGTMRRKFDPKGARCWVPLHMDEEQQQIILHSMSGYLNDYLRYSKNEEDSRVEAEVNAEEVLNTNKNFAAPELQPSQKGREEGAAAMLQSCLLKH